MSSRKYLSTAETSKLIRMALKESFTGVKFSVRSDNYAGGSSIDVRWTDGPAEKLVESICKRFDASYFDGSIDYKGSRYHLLDGESVRMGADFIFCRRDFSDAAVERACAVVAKEYGNPEITAEAYRNGRLWRVEASGYRDAGTAVCERLSKVSSVAAPAPSATLARIQFAGDDGYGHGTVGDMTKPEADRMTGKGYTIAKYIQTNVH